MLSFTRLDLLREKQVEFDEEVTFTLNDFSGNERLNDLRDCKVSGKGYYTEDLELFSVKLQITGLMIVPCAVTLQAVEYPFATDTALSFSFKDDGDDEVIPVKDKIDLLPEILQVILAEVPLKVTIANVEYRKGKDWEVISEADYLAEKQENDPRLAKLAEYKFEDNEEE